VRRSFPRNENRDLTCQYVLKGQIEAGFSRPAECHPRTITKIDANIVQREINFFRVFQSEFSRFGETVREPTHTRPCNQIWF
jgi:hypothetical protein